ncbi:hypothetical protein L21TH_2060 [Caldisalinibacter kiritimatiensis]|uniref:Lecithin:cholesterol acyltransferase n=2 Tax=Caldisalinibacter kiritimatiensis TaxID=1304284 RepID=R1CT87_9FIRM|nr:hypothetical protein L21TH_2060 [Caldisalinibacter kiritimatiensis]
MFFLRRYYIRKNNKPIVFIPGLFGSLGDAIIPGTGEFDFGLAEYAYRPIMDNFKYMGYEENKNLFVAYYDWTKPNLYSAKKYLIPVIKKAKEITGARKVDIVCHSMGGIVARAYVQSNFYAYDVDKLVMLGTPNSGSVEAYYFWAGGHLPNENLRGNFFYRLIRESFLWIFKIIYKKRNDLELLRDLFPSIQELLPTSDYGDYLFYQIKNKHKEFIPIRNMNIENKFLNKLNRNQRIIYKRRIKLYEIAGVGVDTEKYICVQKHNKYRKLWSDGMPLYSVKTSAGDGTVTLYSASSLYGIKKYIYSDHVDMLKDSKELLANILNRRILYKAKVANCIQTKYFYSIVAKNVNNITINKDNREKTILEEAMNKDKEISIKQIGQNDYWIIINLAFKKNINLSFIPMIGKESDIVIFFSNRNGEIKKIKEFTTSNIYSVNL